MKQIIYIQYTNPAAYPPLEHSSRILADEGWQVLFLGTQALGTIALKFPPHPNIAVRLLPFVPGGWRQKLHYLQFVLWVLVWLLRRRSHWIYASDPLSCPAVLLLSYIPGIRVIYHEHDSPSPGNEPALSGFMRLVLEARRRLARRAELIILPNAKRAGLFRDAVSPSRNILIVWNCPRQDEVITQPRPGNEGNLRLLYHGSITPDRFLLPVIKALPHLPKNIELWVIGYETVGSQGYIAELKEHASQNGVAERVFFFGAMPRYRLLEACRTCDVGLAFMPLTTEDINLKHIVGASNKAFDYMASGLALLVSDLPDWREMYVEPGFGLACNPEDPNSIAERLRYLAKHLDKLGAMGERGRQKILAEWNYERHFSAVLQYLYLENGRKT